MKITKTKLKQVIKEEVVKLLTENQYQQYAIKILSLLDYNEHEDPGTFAQALDLYTQLKGDIEVNAPTQNDQILAKLKVFDQFVGTDIQDVDFLSGLSELNVTEKIDLGYCMSLQNVDGLKGCTNLTSLNLWLCSSLENVDGLQGLANLNWLNLNDCSALQNVDGLKECTNLTTLSLSGCSSLENVDGLKGCTSLTSLNLSFCESLQNVDVLKECTSLTSLNLKWCTSLPIKLQQRFRTDSSGTAHEKFMKALNASKRSQP